MTSDRANDRPENRVLNFSRRQFLSSATTLALASRSEAMTKTFNRTITRTEFFVPVEHGVNLHVREVRPANRGNGRTIVLVHGARAPGVASFDLNVPGGSLAGDLARKGWTAIVMDVRGYGRSSRPAAMSLDPAKTAPLVTSRDAARDVAAVATWAARRAPGTAVTLLGWATGGHWAGMAAALFTRDCDQLILLNSLYGGIDGHPMLGHGTAFEHPTIAGMFNQAAFGAYQFAEPASLVDAWERHIPIGDKDAWRDPAVANAFAMAALESDPSHATRSPPTFRCPSGPMEDSFYLATGRQLWDAASITADVLFIRGGLDFWSRPQDGDRLKSHLVRASRVQLLTIPDATHHLHLDRAERGRTALLEKIEQSIA